MAEFKGIEYKNECDFMKKTRALKKYFMPAYKDLVFEFKEKKLFNLENGRHTYNLKVSKKTELIYGKFQLVYSVENGRVIFEDIKPNGLLLDCYRSYLFIEKGTPCRDERDYFKINVVMLIK